MITHDYSNVINKKIIVILISWFYLAKFISYKITKVFLGLICMENES